MKSSLGVALLFVLGCGSSTVVAGTNPVVGCTKDADCQIGYFCEGGGCQASQRTCSPSDSNASDCFPGEVCVANSGCTAGAFCPAPYVWQKQRSSSSGSGTTTTTAASGSGSTSGSGSGSTSSSSSSSSSTTTTTASGTTSSSGSGSSTTSGAACTTWHCTDAANFFNNYCDQCHGFTCSSPAVDPNIAARLQSGSMPPYSQPQPPSADVNNLLQWISCGEPQ